jgi:predicted transcriptional regulator
MDGYGLYATASWTLVVDKPAPKPVIARPTPQQTTTTGGVAVSIWVLIFVLATEPSRYTLLKFLWVPLYTKIRKDEVLDQFVRGRIFGFIEHNPGVTYSQIKRKVGVGNGTLTHHLSMLEKQNYVKAQRDGLYKRFYPRDYHIDEDAVELNNMQKDIYFLAKTRPGISQKDLADELEVSERVVSYHIHLMQEARLLRVERTGRKHALFVEEN